MKRIAWLVLLSLASFAVLSRPATAQEDSGRVSMGGGDFDGSQYGDDGSGRNRRDSGAPAPSPIDPIRQVLAKANLPLTADQEKALQAIVAAQQAAQASQSGAGGQAGAGQGGGGQRAGGQGNAGGSAGGSGGGERRSGGGGRGNALQEKLVAALSPAQQAAWKKYQRDQIIARGGYPALRLALEEAGSAPTAEQESQLQEQFRNYDQQMKDLKTAAGPGNEPDAAKVKEVETQHLTALIKMLDPAQRKALIEWKKSTQTAAVAH